MSDLPSDDAAYKGACEDIANLQAHVAIMTAQIEGLRAAAESVCEAHQWQRRLWQEYCDGDKSDETVNAIFGAAAELGEKMDILCAAIGAGQGIVKDGGISPTGREEAVREVVEALQELHDSYVKFHPSTYLVAQRARAALSRLSQADTPKDS